MPSALSEITQTAWGYVTHDYGVEVLGVRSADLGVEGPTPDVAEFQWKPDTREDALKDDYMAYIKDIFLLDEDTGVWFGGTPRLCV